MTISPRLTRSTSFSIYGVPLLSLTSMLTMWMALYWGWTTQATSDFHVLYQSAVDLRDGLDPYARVLSWGMPNANPPAAILLMAPIARLSRESAFIAWTALGIGSFLLSVIAIARALGRAPLPLLLVACSTQGVPMAIQTGQVSLFFAPIATAAWLADRRDDQRLAGLWLGTLLYLKPFFGLFLLYLVWRRSWRTLAWTLGTGAMWTALGLAAGGTGAYATWFASGQHINQFAANMLNASIRGLSERLFNPFYPDTQRHYSPLVNAPGLAVWSWLVICLGIVLVTARALRNRSRDHHWALVGLTSLLISPLGWIYYLPMLVGPLAAVWRRGLSKAAVLAAVPAGVLLAQHFGVLGTAFIGSAYVWAISLAWLVVVRAEPRERPGTATVAGAG